MKAKLLILILFLSVNAWAQQTQEPAFMIKAGVLIPYLQAEFPISKHESINIGTTATYTIADKTDCFVAPSVELRHFYLKSNKIQSYIGAYTRARIYDVKQGTESYFVYADKHYDYKTLSFAAGTLIGNEVIIKKHFVIDIFLGAGYVFYRKDLRNENAYTYSKEYFLYPFRNLDIRLGVGIGYVKYKKKK